MLQNLITYFAGTYQPTPTEQAIGNVLGTGMLIIFIIVFGFIILVFIKTPSYIKNYKSIRRGRYLVLVIGLLLGLFASWYNGGQLDYIFWYPFFVIMILEAALSIWTKREINIYYGTSKPLFSEKTNHFIGALLLIVAFLAIASFTYTGIDRAFHKKRFERYDRCVSEQPPPKNSYSRRYDTCFYLKRKQWGF